jgi:hypothetical protein
MPQLKKHIPIIDCHVHFAHPSLMEPTMEVMRQLEVGKLNIVCTPDQRRLSLVPDALYFKAHYPEQVYVFGGLDISALFRDPQRAGELFADFADQLIAMGCDGIKMIEGKPQIRKMLPIPDFDAPVWEPYWARLEERGIPVLFHVNDPETFWDRENVPSWALEQGWFYGDGSFVNNEAQYTQVLNLLDRHPNLKIIFAHFFFLSAQLDRLAGYLDRFPNMVVDLTPGIEMYRNFSNDPGKTREFFLKYQDRILFGTDIGAKALLAQDSTGLDSAESITRGMVVRNFLELEGPISLPDKAFLFDEPEKPFIGLGLSDEILKKIYSRNFERVAGEKPRSVVTPAVIGACEQLQHQIQAMGSAIAGIPGDPSVAEMVSNYFKTGTK